MDRKRKLFYITWMEKMLHLAIAAVALLALFSLLGQGEWKGYAVETYSGTCSYEEENWTLRVEGEEGESPISLPGFLPMEMGKTYSLSSVLTYDGSRDREPYVFFYSHHMYCTAWLEGEQVFHYMPEDIRKLDRAKSPGNVYVTIPLPRDCLGKTLELRFVPTLDIQMDYELPYVRFGDYSTTVHHQFLEDLPHNLVGILAAFLGIMSIFFSSMALMGREYREGLFIGLFALVFSVYNMTECPFNLYFISNPYYTYLINYTGFSLMPVTMMAFLRERFRGKWHRRLCLGSAVGGLVLLALQWLLHFTGIMDMREFLKFIHLEYMVDFVMIFLLTALMGRTRLRRSMLIQSLPLLVGMAVDLAIYYFHWDLSNSDAEFSSVAIVVFLLLELRNVWRSSIEIYKDSVRSRYYQEMAFEDNLTGVGNRRAFEAEKEAVLAGEQKFDTMIVCSADVNDLKKVNDTLGHSAGDRLIQSAAQVLTTISAGCGKTFRVGGDEFAVFLYDVTEKELEEKLDRARVKTRSINADAPAVLSIALGYETVEGLDIESAVQKADRRMYDQKSRMKEVHQPGIE